MRPYLYTLLLLFAFLLSSGQNMKYYRIRMQADAQKIAEIAKAGVNLDDAFMADAHTLILELSEDELETLRNLSVDLEIQISDLLKYYAERNLLPDSKTDLHSGTALSKQYPVPTGFELGSLGGFSDYEECMTHLDQMFSMYPELITPRMESGPFRTQEGHPLYMVKLSNMSLKTIKPKVLYTGMIHAREPIGMQHLLYYMYYLLGNYGSDPVITYLLDYAELFFIPVLNPDGYLYNQQIAPNGGGMWRKNRRINDGESFGVDLNRNFGYMWGYDNTGSSPVPASDIYRGVSPFSEPETLMLKELCESNSFIIALNYHSYSNLLLYPWGYVKSITPDDNIYSEHARLMTRDNGYVTGTSSVLLYLVNGGSDDWMYGDQVSKNKIFSYTPEVGSTNDGFWPAINRIIPLCQENMTQSLMAGLLSLQYADFSDQSLPYISESGGFLKFSVQRLGFQNEGLFTVSFESQSPWMIELGAPVTFNNLALLETAIDSIDYTIDPLTPSGTGIYILAKLNNGHFTITDTLIKVVGIPELTFYDSCSSSENWTGDWAITISEWVTPPSSITDSPYGNYPDNTTSSITTLQTIDLQNAAWAQLSFFARWDIEAGWDFVQLLASEDDGASWVALQGKYTKPGNNFQAPGQPVYDGIQTSWVREEINLSPFSGKHLLLRFTLISNTFVTADGFYFDDLSILKIPFSVIPSASFGSDNSIILQNSSVQFTDLSSGYPNSWWWQFEGGSPDFSTLQHPIVQYSSPGNYDVTLAVTNEFGTDTLLYLDYLLVLDSLLCKPVVYAGNDTTIAPWESYQTMNAQVENFKSLKWSTSGDGIFDNDTVLHVTYLPGQEDIGKQYAILTLTALPMYEICDSASHSFRLNIADLSGIHSPFPGDFLVYPNPAQDFVNIYNNGKYCHCTVEFMDLAGNILFVQGSVNGSHLHIDLRGISNGVYLLRQRRDNLIVVKKLVIIRW